MFVRLINIAVNFVYSEREQKPLVRTPRSADGFPSRSDPELYIAAVYITAFFLFVRPETSEEGGRKAQHNVKKNK